MNMMVVQGSPDSQSLSKAAFDKYLAGARAHCEQVEGFDLSAESFDPVLRMGYRERMPEDPFIEKSISALVESSHLTLIFPVWWAAEPALLKGWFDRVLVPGVAFKFHQGKPLPEGLLAGRTATLISSSHAPGWFARAARSYPINRIRANVLKQVGIKVTNVVTYGGLDTAKDTAEARRAFLQLAQQAGVADAQKMRAKPSAGRG